MVRVVVVLLVILFLISRLVSAVELCYNSCVSKVDVLGCLPSIDIVAAVCVERPHLAEIERLGVLRVLVAPLSILSIDIGCAVAVIHAGNQLVALVPSVGALVLSRTCFMAAAVIVILFYTKKLLIELRKSQV